MTSFKNKLTLGLVVAATALLAACGGDDGVDDRLGISKPSVRLLNTVPVGVRVDLFQNGAPTQVSNAPYKFVSAYFDISKDNNLFQLRVAGTQTVIGQTTINGATGHKYSLIATPGSSGAELVVIDDPYDKGLTSDKARVRGFNAALNAQNIDMYITAPAIDLNSVSPTLGAISYKNANPASGSDSIYFDSGTYRLRITTAGTKNVIFDSGALTLDKNADWLITTIPVDGIGAVVPNSIKVLVAQSSTGAGDSQELVTQPLTTAPTAPASAVAAQ
ncbi:DUF4397 domain-containing protein [Cupriavidus plantarum]|uniref:Uncharacterized protein DUF4397 n=1 Tax=Cupriavidus plantarum TaxID=942865 RepID=A0A316EML4_9BURK|nr:DUF4397 domain-containing protein [Cupriavidus plantarum]NYI01454.1 hypothetical protein [Cupriavidus plantarum]PWK32676.1 uncharacterized protein DUF4397 [Cupriavidus plantarum]REE90771.1 uncharacterized protein DUF4397 [Cupriavidus plantarum]RLK33442.1 uncharacterized protein DUF4397 [Cupriavidus plantarum]CAG2154738.1 hypothetical protein LMG26296_05602 [Cupriavidus plantarum]